MKIVAALLCGAALVLAYGAWALARESRCRD